MNKIINYLTKKKIIVAVASLIIMSAMIYGRNQIYFQFNLDRANYYDANENYKAALDMYNWLIEHKPDIYELYINKGIILAKLNQYDEALSTFNEAENLCSNDAELYYNMAYLYELIGEDNLKDEYIKKAATFKTRGLN